MAPTRAYMCWRGGIRMNWWISFRVAASLSAQQTPPNEKLGLVEGRVIHAVTGEPISKAHVTLGSYAAGDDFEMIATTDEAGHFRFADVTPGVYKLISDKAGFLPGGYGEVKPGDVDLF